MLDVISGALGVFLLLMIILMPYYKKETIDALREVETLKEQLAAAENEAEAAQAEAEQAQAEAEQAKAEAEKASKARALAQNLDLVFVMDTTGSMEPEIDDLRKSLLPIIRVLDRATETLRIG